MQCRILVMLISFCLCVPLAAANAWQSRPESKQRPNALEEQNNLAAPASIAEAAEQATPTKPDAKDQWALLVGISAYPGEIQSLRYARRDAQSIKDLLVKAAGFSEDHIRLLTDDGVGDAKATKQNILNAVDQYLAPRVQAGQQVIVFLAGHGLTRGLGVQAKGYFLPVDVNAQTKESLESTAIDLEDLGQRLGALKASQFTLFMDSCREDPFPGRGIKGNTMTDVMARGLTIKRKEGQAQTSPPTAIIFYACQVGERAYEDPKLEHGVFTYFILNGIRELASNPDGRVDAGHLANYLRENVRRWSVEFQQRAKFPAEQTPTMTATEVRGPMVVVRMAEISSELPAPPSVGTLALHTSPENANVTLNGKQLGTSPIEKELQPGEYSVRAEAPGFEPAETKITVVAGYQQELTVTLKPTTTNANYDKGVQFEAQRLWPQAIASYEQAIRQDPSLLPSYERLSNVYIAGSRYRDSVDLLTTAAEKFPDNVVLHARRSRALSEWAKIEEQQDLSMNPRVQKAVKQKDARKEALKAAELAVQKAPDSAIAQLAIGYAYSLDERSYSKALSAFVLASTITPEDAESYFGVGFTYRLMKQYQQAIPQLKKALDLRPDYYEAHRELAYCYHSLGENDQAIKEYNTATGYRGETNNSGEMAGNHLALSALYVEKGQKSGGEEGQAYAGAGKGHETEAREYDPTLKAALKILKDSGVAYKMQSYLPPELSNLIDDRGISVPGGIKIPFGKKRP